ncbi:MAG: histidine kinase dimerization/phosphoacceptor domain -containing protein [Ferruginibacter sp.]
MDKYILISIVFILSLADYGCNYKKNATAHVPKNRLAEENKDKGLLEQALQFVYRPGENKVDLDSAIILLKQCDSINKFLNDDALQARAYFVYSNAYREGGQINEGLNCIKKSVELYKKAALSTELADAYLEMIQYQSVDTDDGVDKRIELYKLADSLYFKTNLKEKRAFVLKNIADLQQIKGNFLIALGYLKECETIYVNTHYKSLQGIYDLMGACYTGLGDYNNGIKYGLKAISAAENDKDTSLQLSTIYNRLAVSYYKLKSYEESVSYLEKALVIATKYGAKADALIISNNLNSLLLTLNRWQQSLELSQHTELNFKPSSNSDSVQLFAFYTRAYVEGKKYDFAKKYASLLGMLIKRGPRFNPIFIKAYSTMVNYFIAIHDYGNAQKNLDEQYRFYQKNPTREGLTIYYLSKYKLDSAKADFKSAFESLSIYKRKTDSTFNQAKSTELAQIQVQYETEKKDQDIMIKQKNIELLTNKDKLQEVRIKKANITRNIIIVTAIFLIALFFTGYTIKQRNNSKLQLQQDEIGKQNEQLKELLLAQQKLVSEKEWLVKEIHHRVKNNLQIVISLLNTQAAHLQEGDALIAIQESRRRMQVISLLHQKLYQAETSGVIDMQVYIREVVSYLKESFRGINHLYFEQQIDPINLDISHAVPIGLILNEAITNCIKYAFPNKMSGKIMVTFTKEENGNLQLIISDNGIGIYPSIALKKRNSLGMQLMQTLSEQLDGKMKIENKDGTIVNVYFRQQAVDKITEIAMNI